MKREPETTVYNSDYDNDINNINHNESEEKVPEAENYYEEKIIYEVSEESIKRYIEEITQYIRNLNSEGKVISHNMIVKELESFDYTVEVREFSVYENNTQEYGRAQIDNNYYDFEKDNGNNIIGNGYNIIAYTNKKDSNKILYITAHYDTTSNTEGVIDNATGVAAVLELAKVLKGYEGSINVVFIFFDAEEKIMQGSREFVSNLSDKEKENIIGCINIDMIGQKESGSIAIHTFDGSENTLTEMWKNVCDLDTRIKMGGSTDELSFYYAGIPAFTFANEIPNFKILTESDRESQLDRVDYESITELVRQIKYFIVEE